MVGNFFRGDGKRGKAEFDGVFLTDGLTGCGRSLIFALFSKRTNETYLSTLQADPQATIRISCTHENKKWEGDPCSPSSAWSEAALA